MSIRVCYYKCFQRTSKGFDTVSHDTCRKLQRVSKMFSHVFKGFPEILLRVFKELLKGLLSIFKGIISKE